MVPRAGPCRACILQKLHEQQVRQERATVVATFLSTQQVQDLLDVDASTIYRMAADGRLPAVRIGRQRRFPADEIEAMLRPATASNGAAAKAGQPLAPSSSTGTSASPSTASTAPTAPTAPTVGAVPATAGHRPPAAVAIPIPPSDSPLPPELATATLETVAPALGVSMV